MIEYIKGTIEDLSPTELILESYGIGYHILISLQTYEQLQGKKEAKIYIHHLIKEDDEQYFGFANKDERELYRLLTGVSGVGGATARMMLSSLTCDEIRNAIIGEDVAKIKSIKGIGLKTAQRLIIELKDKIVKGGGSDSGSIFSASAGTNANTEEAITALVLLGFSKPNVTKAVASIIKNNPSANLEEIIKAGLKIL